jgi:pimeloyl-ACP methyl ester carboxylesterase
MNVDTMIRNVITCIGFPLAIANEIISRNNKVKELGKIVHVNEKKIHVVVSGKEDAEITVILDAGLTRYSLDWYNIQPEVSTFAKVVSFDRAGYGWSSRSQGTYTSEEAVEDLVNVLQALEIDGPFILVGHSFGSLNMRLFASKNQKDVKGIVLIDPVHERRYTPCEWSISRKREYKKQLRLFKVAYLTSPIGLPRLLKQPIGRKELPGPIKTHGRYVGYLPKAFEAAYKELINSKSSAKQVKNAKPLLKDLPIVILTSNNRSKDWKEEQEFLCKLTNNTKKIQTDHGHSIHIENPKLIIDTIKDVITNNTWRK